jgi:Domain of unknown function (DUF4440)
MRRMLVSAVLVGLALSGQTFAQTKAKAGVDADLQQKILDLEKKRIAAMVTKNIAVLDALLADDLSYTHSGGSTDTKASFITLIKERGRYLGVDYSNTQVISWSGNSVVVRGTAQIRLEATPSYYVLFMDVWALREGAWKMVAWQATRVPEP